MLWFLAIIQMVWVQYHANGLFYCPKHALINNTIELDEILR